MDLPDFLNCLPDGEIVLTGRRIGLFHLVQYYNEGESAEMLASRYPTVPLALVHKVIAFYLDHQKEVDVYLNACDSALAEERNSSRRLDLCAFKGRKKVSQFSLSRMTKHGCPARGNHVHQRSLQLNSGQYMNFCIFKEA